MREGRGALLPATPVYAAFVLLLLPLSAPRAAPARLGLECRTQIVTHGKDWERGWRLDLRAESGIRAHVTAGRDLARASWWAGRDFAGSRLGIRVGRFGLAPHREPVPGQAARALPTALVEWRGAQLGVAAMRTREGTSFALRARPVRRVELRAGRWAAGRDGAVRRAGRTEIALPRNRVTLAGETAGRRWEASARVNVSPGWPVEAEARLGLRLPRRGAAGRPARCGASLRWIPRDGLVPSPGHDAWRPLREGGLLRWSVRAVRPLGRRRDLVLEAEGTRAGAETPGGAMPWRLRAGISPGEARGRGGAWSLALIAAGASRARDEDPGSLRARVSRRWGTLRWFECEAERARAAARLSAARSPVAGRRPGGTRLALTGGGRWSAIELRAGAAWVRSRDGAAFTWVEEGAWRRQAITVRREALAVWGALTLRRRDQRISVMAGARRYPDRPGAARFEAAWSRPLH